MVYIYRILVYWHIGKWVYGYIGLVSKVCKASNWIVVRWPSQASTWLFSV